MKVIVQKLCPLCNLELSPAVLLIEEEFCVRSICINHKPSLAFQKNEECDISLFLEKIKSGDILTKKMTPRLKSLLENKFQKSVLDCI